MPLQEEITVEYILNLVAEQVVLPGDDWSKVVRKIESRVAAEYEILLTTPLAEA